MSNGRRTNDRRRRVLYSAHQADHNPSTAASRREAERLREARCPPAAYGSRVHRRLRAGWFSLVPVRRRTLISVAAVLAFCALLLAAAHYASVAWPSMAYRPEIARPLRLDRADSFGRWFLVSLLAAGAAASLLIYQLRRYRNDDFKGRYRLWRLVVIVMMLASVNSLVSIIDWTGALLDAGFGRRVALTGSDWIRLVVSIGGAVLALRLVAEVRRCRIALGMMLLTCALLALPEAAKWNVLQIDSVGKWAIVTSAPLLASTALLISLVGYLRMLYREVQQIEEGGSLRDRLQQFFRRSGVEDQESEADGPQQGKSQNRQVVEDDEEYEEEELDEEADAAASRDDESAPHAKRRWFGLRRGKQPDGQDDEQEESPAKPSRPQKKRRFSMRLSPPAEKSPQASDDDSDAPSESNEQTPPGRRGWLRRKKSAEPDASENDSINESSRKPTSRQTDTAKTDANAIDTDEIDWNSLSKAERRRLRKQLKRQNRAA